MWSNQSSGFMESTTGEVEFNNMDKAAVLNVLHFLYTDKLRVSPSNCVGVLIYSIMLGLTEVADHCRSMVNQNLSMENIIQLLEIADLYCDQILLRLCINFVKNNFEHVKKLPGLTNLSQNVLNKIKDTMNRVYKKQRKMALLQ